MVVAEFPDSERQKAPPAPWQPALACDEDGYSMRIYVAALKESFNAET
jgi:hypothetical protein